MPINLANVNITLEQFQEISSGKYNAGEVKLASEQSLAKMNNHVHLWRKNVETISHEETIAIKVAFVRALAQNGVGDDVVNAVRREIGLAHNGTADRTLHERSVKPLSRQQIREILDRNAAAINAARGAGTIRTDAEIHANVSIPKRSGIITKRTATNTATESSRATTESISIVRAQRVIAGDIDFHNYNERRLLLDTALSQKRMIMDRSGGNPSTAPDASITFKTEAGHSIELKLGMSDAAYIEKLDNMILRLRSTYCPNDAILATRAEFLALKEPAEIGKWFNGLTHDDVGGQKARTIAVLVMQERGITDSETLSLVNRLGNADAISFLYQLISAGRTLSGDSLRQSPMLQSFINRANATHVNVPQDAQTHIPDLTPPQYNDLIYKGFFNNPNELPESFHKMACEIRAEVARRLGEEAMEPNGSLLALLDNNRLKALFPTDATATQRVTADSIRQGYLDGMLQTSAKRLIVKHVIDTAERLGTPVHTPFSVANALIERNPDIIDVIAACGSVEDVAVVFTRLNNEMEAAVARQCAIERCDAAAEGWAREAIAAELNLPPALLQKPQAVNVTHMTRLSNNLADKIGKGKIAASTPDEIEQAFRNMIRNFAHDRAELLRQIDSLQLSPPGRDAFRTILLSMNKTDYVDLNGILASAQRLDFSPLVTHINNGASSKDVYADMMSLEVQMQQEVRQALANVHGEVGPEEMGFVTMLLLSAAADRVPGGFQALESFFARPDVVNEMQEFTANTSVALNFQSILPTDGDPATLRDALAHPADLPPLHAMSLVQACADAGLGDLSAEEAIALFAPGQTAGDILADALSFHPGKVSPTLLQGLASGALRPVAAGILPMRDAERAFLNGPGANHALQLGYHQNELPRLAHAFALCRASGMDEAAAIDAISDPLSNPMRLIQYGGRFTATVANFRKGLALLDSFSNWFTQTVTNIEAGQRTTPTAINANRFAITPRSGRALEKFVFEELAVNKSIVLNTDDPESVFGMTKNPAMRFVGRNFARSFENSLAQMPPAKRSLLYAVFDVLNPLKQTTDERETQTIVQTALLAVRVLKNYDAIAQLRKDGNLDRAHLIPLLYSDFGIPSTADTNTINQMVGDAIYGLISNELKSAPALVGNVQLLMESSAETIQTCTKAVLEGRTLPIQPGISTFALSFDDLDGSPSSARVRLLTDLNRPTVPTMLATGQSAIAPEDTHFTVILPDSEALVAQTGLGNDPAVIESGRVIADRLQDLCGRVHVAQLSSVYTALSQAALGPLNRGLTVQGIVSNEHMPVTFTLSRNDETGAVTIRYSEPAGLPVRFHWETTVALDGSTTSTPLVIDP